MSFRSERRTDLGPTRTYKTTPVVEKSAPSTQLLRLIWARREHERKARAAEHKWNGNNPFPGKTSGLGTGCLNPSVGTSRNPPLIKRARGDAEPQAIDHKSATNRLAQLWSLGFPWRAFRFVLSDPWQGRWRRLPVRRVVHTLSAPDTRARAHPLCYYRQGLAFSTCTSERQYGLGSHHNCTYSHSDE